MPELEKKKVVIEDNLRLQDDGGPVVEVALPSIQSLRMIPPDRPMGLGMPNPNMENSVLSEDVVEARNNF